MLSKALLSRSFATAVGGKKVGFLGLGNMGLPMTMNLRKNGFEVTGYEIGDAQKKAATAAGTPVAASIKDAIKDADWIVTALPKTEHVDNVLHMKDGIFECAKKGAYILDVSTISPVASAKFNQEAAQHGLTFMDSPMSGGINGAKAGTLSFMVGGTDAEFAHAKTLLSGMGANFFHCGKAGNGEVAKLVNNLMLGVNMCAASEGIAFGEKMGIDPKILTDVISVSTGRSFVVTNYNPYPGIVENAPSTNNYDGGFGTLLMLKDLNLAIDAAKDSGATSEFAQSAANYFEDTAKQGGANKDYSYVYQYIHANKKL